MYSTVSVAACGVNLMKPMFSISKGVTFSTVTGGACRWTLVLADTTRQARIRRSRSASLIQGEVTCRLRLDVLRPMASPYVSSGTATLDRRSQDTKRLVSPSERLCRFEDVTTRSPSQRGADISASYR